MHHTNERGGFRVHQRVFQCTWNVSVRTNSQKPMPFSSALWGVVTREEIPELNSENEENIFSKSLDSQQNEINWKKSQLNEYQLHLCHMQAQWSRKCQHLDYLIRWCWVLIIQFSLSKFGSCTMLDSFMSMTLLPTKENKKSMKLQKIKHLVTFRHR